MAPPTSTAGPGGADLGTSAQTAESEKKAAVFEAVPQPIVAIDAEGRIICWNAAAEQTFGYKSIEAIGQPLADLIIPARLRERHLRGFGNIKRGAAQFPPEPIETWARRADDREFPVEISISAVRLNGTPAFVAHVHDLSNQRRGEAELDRLIAEARQANAQAEGEYKRLQQIFATSPFLVLVTEGPRHHVRFSTRSSLEVFQSSHQVVGRPLAEVYPELAQLGFVQLFSRVYETGEVFTSREIPLKQRGWGPAVRYFDYTLQPQRDDQDRVTGVIAHGIEVTDKVAARQHLEQALHARDELVSRISHELRNPLNVLQLQIASTAARLNSAIEPTGRKMMIERIAAMERTMTLLSGMVDRLLEVSRMVSGPLRLEPEEFDLVAHVGKVLEQMKDEARGCETTIQHSGTLLVNWDRKRTDELISNLLSNAYKYGAGRPVELQLEPSNNSVRLAVQDHGNGIPLTAQRRIFERFEHAAGRSDANAGLGLGLWICRQIVTAHGGHIWVESALGQGARFVAEIPSHPEFDSPQ